MGNKPIERIIKLLVIEICISAVLSTSAFCQSEPVIQVQEVSDLSVEISTSVCRVTVTVRDNTTKDTISNATVVWDKGDINELTTITNENGETTCDLSQGWHTINVSKTDIENNQCYKENFDEFRCYYCGNPERRTVYLDRCDCPLPEPVPALSPIGILALVLLLGLCSLIAIKKKK